MNKIEINHHEFDTFILAMLIIPVIMVLPFAFIFYFAENVSTSEQIGTIIGLFSFIMVFIIAFAFDFVFDKRIIAVEYDREKIVCKPFFKEKSVMLSDMKQVYYYTYKEYRGKGIYKQRLELCIVTNQGEFFLNDKIGAEYVTSSLAGDDCTPELIRLYNFIADIYPEKAYGFKQQD